ncbi:MAG: MMPL family transporter [Planctomycetales bacterium]|nr:MMPL family transporter [Planctomycetales bacterium]
MNLYAQLLVKYNTLATSIVALTTILAGIGLLWVRFEDEPGKVIERGGPEFARLQAMNRAFGPDDNDLLVVVDGDDLLSPRVLNAFRQALDEAKAVDGVKSVFSVFDLRRRGTVLEPLVPKSLQVDADTAARVATEVAGHPIVKGHLMSDDGTTMVAVIRMAGESLSVPYLSPRIEQLQNILAAASTESSVRFRLAGHQMARIEMLESVWAEGPRLLVISGLLSALIALILFRRLSAVICAVAGPAVGVTWTLGFFGWSGIQLNALSTALPTLVFVIGFTDSVHLVLDIRSRKQNADLPTSIVQTLSHVGPACALTSLTTMIGFGSLMIAEVTVVNQFGRDCAIGTLLSFLAVVSVVPLLAGMVSANEHRNEVTRNSLAFRFIHVMSSPQLRLSVSTSAIVACVGLGFVATKLRPDIQWMEMLPVTSDTKKVWNHCDERMGGTLLTYVVVRWPDEKPIGMNVLRVMYDVHKVLDDSDSVRSPFSIINLLLSMSPDNSIRESDLKRLRAVPKEVRERLVRLDESMAVVTTYVPDSGAALLMPEFDRIDRELSRLSKKYPDFTLELTGTSVVAARNVHQIVDDLGKSLALASVIIFLVMTIALRSVALGLISVVPNAFPLLFAAATLAWSGDALRLASAMTFSICLGIAVDDTIHFMTRFKHERAAGKRVEDSLARTMHTVGVAMMVTSVTLLSGFSVMAISHLPSVQTFARLAGVAIVAALVADLLFLPALLACFGHERTSKNEA